MRFALAVIVVIAMQSRHAHAFGIGGSRRGGSNPPEPRVRCDGRLEGCSFHGPRLCRAGPKHQQQQQRPSVAVTATRDRDDDDDDDGAAVSAFVEHMFSERGCQGEPGCVEVRSRNGQRGVFLNHDVEEGDYVFAVPAGSAWVVETPATDEWADAERGLMFWHQMQDGGDDDDDDDDNDDDENWEPYLAVLPSPDDGSFDPTPDFWYEYEIRALELPTAVDRGLTRKWRIQDLASRVRSGDDDDLSSFLSMSTGDDTFGGGIVSPDALRFATWIVNSRSVTVMLGDDEEEDFDPSRSAVVLVPLMDMINHSSDLPNAHFAVLGEDDDEDGDEEEDTLYYAVVADRDLRKGEELLISYETEVDSSVDLLLQYGFVPETNPYDVDFWEEFWAEQEEENPPESMPFWTTTLGDDEDRLAALDDIINSTENDDEDRERSVIERTILRFRIRMKRAYAEWRDGSTVDPE